MDIDLLKIHLRVDHSFEDNLIQEYAKWAQDEVKDSVSTEANRNEGYFNDNSHFERAVALLAAYYYENRVAHTEKALQNAPDAVLSAVQKLRVGYTSLEVDADAKAVREA